MKYRILGSTGLRVSVVGVGTWRLGGEWGRRYSEPDAARDRDRWVIATKVGHKFHQPFERTEPRQPADRRDNDVLFS